MVQFIEVSNNNEAKEELKELFHIVQTRDLPFQTPKPTKLLELFVENLSGEGDIVLDFFAGSSSTAHAVLAVNARDKKHRKFIMIQAEEGNDLRGGEYKTIAEFGLERIRLAGEKIKKESGANDVDYGYRVFRVDDTNMNDVFYAPSAYTQDLIKMLETNIKQDRSAEDIFFECLISWGLPLSLPYEVEQIGGTEVIIYNDGDLIACFDENISEDVIDIIAKREPIRAVFVDSIFKNSPEKINLKERFKLLSPNTTVKVL